MLPDPTAAESEAVDASEGEEMETSRDELDAGVEERSLPSEAEEDDTQEFGESA